MLLSHEHVLAIKWWKQPQRAAYPRFLGRLTLDPLWCH